MGHPTSPAGAALRKIPPEFHPNSTLVPLEIPWYDCLFQLFHFFEKLLLISVLKTFVVGICTYVIFCAIVYFLGGIPTIYSTFWVFISRALIVKERLRTIVLVSIVGPCFGKGWNSGNNQSYQRVSNGTTPGIGLELGWNSIHCKNFFEK